MDYISIDNFEGPLPEPTSPVVEEVRKSIAEKKAKHLHIPPILPPSDIFLLGRNIETKNSDLVSINYAFKNNNCSNTLACTEKTTATKEEKSKNKTHTAQAPSLSQAFVWHEIISKPLALRDSHFDSF